MTGIKIDKHFAYKVLKEDLFAYHDISTKADQSLFTILEDAAEGNKGALKYLHTSPEIQQLLEALQGASDSYTIENFDAIWDYLKSNPSHLDNFHFTFDEFYEEIFDELINYLMRYMFQLQNINAILYLTDSIKKGQKALEKKSFPAKHNELTFVVKNSFDVEDGAIVCEVYMGKTGDIDDEDIPDIEDTNDDDQDDNSEDYGSGLENDDDPIDISNFVCIRKKREAKKEVVLAILKGIGYGDDLFKMFDLEEEKIKAG